MRLRLIGRRPIREFQQLRIQLLHQKLEVLELRRIRDDVFQAVVGLKVMKGEGLKGCITTGFKIPETKEFAFICTWEAENATTQKKTFKNLKFSSRLQTTPRWWMPSTASFKVMT